MALAEAAPRDPPVPAPPRRRTPRRFVWACVIGIALSAVPYVWLIGGGGLDILRTDRIAGVGTFYDTQARALLDGHLSVPEGSLGIEAFVVDGHSYMYFGPVPSLLRLPVLAVTHRFDGRLTGASMLVGWAVTAVFTSLLLWRVRTLVRAPRGEDDDDGPPAPVTWAEAVSTVVVVGAVCGGSTLSYLAARPIVYHEAITWGVALTIAALWWIVGVADRPTGWRIVGAGTFTLLAVLSRSTLGMGAVAALGLVAAMRLAHRSTRQQWRTTAAVAAAAIVAMLGHVILNYAKFRTPLGLPMETQVYTTLSPERQAMLAANGGQYFRAAFLPTNLWQYLRPDALRLDRLFPFVGLPANPPRVLGGLVYDEAFRSSSVPASMPLLFLLGLGGLVTAFRPRSPGRVAAVRAPLIGAAVGTLGVLTIGYLANRYLADFLPVLVLAAAVGSAELWRRIDARPERPRRRWAPSLGGLAAAAVVLVGLLGSGTGLAIAYASMRTSGSEEELRAYLDTRVRIADATGTDLGPFVLRGDELPETGAADQLFIVGDCAALYWSDGEHGSHLFDRTNWRPVERTGAAGEHPVTVAFAPGRAGERTPLLTVTGTDGARSTISLEYGDDGTGRFVFDGVGFPSVGDQIDVRPGEPRAMTIVADPRLGVASVTLDGDTVLWTPFSGFGEQRLGDGFTGQMTSLEAPPDLCRRVEHLAAGDG